MQIVSNTGVALEFSATGLNSIAIGRNKLANGQTMLESAANLFGGQHLQLGPVLKHSLGNPSKYIVNLTHYYENFVARYKYWIKGNDLSISCSIEHLGKISEPLHFPCFKGLKFLFYKQPVGTLPSWHWTYLQANGTDLMHPSHRTPAGCVWATDGNIGFGAYTASHLTKRKLIHAQWASDSTIPQNPNLEWYIDDIVRPNDTHSYVFNIRVGLNSDWKWLLAPYKEEFLRQSPPIQYEIDERPLAKFSSISESWITPENPLGFNGDARRFDKPEGTQAFVDMVAPALQKAGGQGCLLWQPQGVHPRRAHYRTDFDVFPPEVEKNLPILVEGFKKHGLKVGLCARPGEISESISWSRDETSRLSPHSPTQINRLLQRFENAIDMGFSMFYLDTFCTNHDDFLTLQRIREFVGPKVQLWSEYNFDLALPYCGRYTQWENGWAWLSPWQIEFYRWLMPFSVAGSFNPAKEVYDRAKKNGVIPIIQDYLVKQEVENVNYC